LLCKRNFKVLKKYECVFKIYIYLVCVFMCFRRRRKLFFYFIKRRCGLCVKMRKKKKKKKKKKLYV